MKKLLSIIVLATSIAALLWASGWGRHAVTVEIIAPPSTENTAPRFLLTLRAVYRDDKREFSETVFSDIVAANASIRIPLPERKASTFKRLELIAIHPGFRLLESTYEPNPHHYVRRLPALIPNPWQMPEEYAPEPVDVIESHFRVNRRDWIDALGEEQAGYEVWAYRDILQTLLPRASFSGQSLQAVSSDQRRERIERIAADQRHLMGLMRQPGMAGIDM